MKDFLLFAVTNSVTCSGRPLRRRNAYIYIYIHEICRAGPRPLGAPDRLIILYPFKPILFTLFRGRTGPEHILWRRVTKFRIISGKNSSVRGNLNLLAPCFRLFQWRLSAPYSLALWTAVRLDRHLVRPTPSVTKAPDMLLCWTACISHFSSSETLNCKI